MTDGQEMIPEDAAKDAINDIVDSFILAIDEHVEDEALAARIKNAAEWEIIRRTFIAMIRAGGDQPEFSKGV